MTLPTGTVFVVDDDEGVREYLHALFSSIDLPVRPFASGQGFLEADRLDGPGCLVIDMRMPGMSSFDVQAELASRSICLPVIVITGHGDVESGVRAMKAGAIDFIQKPFQAQSLLEKVQKALAGSAEAHRRHAALKQLREHLARLSPRERQVLDLVVDGEPNKRIAFALGVAEKTVEFHRANLMKKMKARSLAELIRKALIVLPPGRSH